MFRPVATLLAAVAGAAAPLALLRGAGEEPDHAKLPPSSAEIHAALTDAGIDLPGAVERAREVAEGEAAEARFDHETKRFTVELHGRDDGWRVEVDAEGEIVSRQPIQRFPGEPVTGEPVTTESGLVYYDVEEGDGPQPSGSAATVTVHYTGWLLDGRKFDSSRDRGEPTSFRLNQVIRGWTEGVGSMKVGGVRKLVIPYPLAYGPQGKPPVIPPKATLVFDVELLSAE